MKFPLNIFLSALFFVLFALFSTVALHAQVVTETEVEVFPKNNAVSPILPTDFVAEKLAVCQSPIRRSYVPGVTLESDHFLVEADTLWAGKADQLARVVQTLELIHAEAELCASLWRNPGEMPKIPDTQMTQNTEKQLKPRIRILVPDTDARRPAPAMTVWGNEFRNAGETPCRFSVVGQETYLTLEMTNPDELGNTDFLANVRAEMFRSVLHNGRENLQFPAWIQMGLCAVFSGVSNTMEIGNGNPVDILQLPAMPEAETVMDPELCASSAFWVRYFITADDGQHYFPFWEELHRFSQMPLSTDAQYSVRARNDAQFQMSQFLQKQHGSRQELRHSLQFWRFLNGTRGLLAQGTVSEPKGYVRVFWNPTVTVLNLPETPTFTLEEEWQEAFLEMATILKITHKYLQNYTPVRGSENESENISENRNSVSLTRSTMTKNGMKIYEFRESKPFLGGGGMKEFAEHVDLETPPEMATDETTENSEITENAENSEKENAETTVTAEDIQALESVYEWFVNRENSYLIHDVDGTVLTSKFTPQRIEKLFHPEDCAYLLQEYEGNPVLSGTFSDGSVLHVMLEKAREDGQRATIRILGFELSEEEVTKETENKP